MLFDPVVTKSNGFFKDLRQSECITEKELMYFSCEYKKITNFNKRLENVTGRPVISNYVILKMYQSSWIITVNRLWKVVDHTLKIVETS